MKIIKYISIVLGIGAFLASMHIATAQTITYTPLAPLGTYITGGAMTLGQYMEGMFRLLVALAGLFAVVTLIVCGLKLMSATKPDDKNRAKKCIWNAIFGLFLAIMSFSILNSLDAGGAYLQADVSLTNPIPSYPTSSAGGGAWSYSFSSSSSCPFIAGYTSAIFPPASCTGTSTGVCCGYTWTGIAIIPPPPPGPFPPPFVMPLADNVAPVVTITSPNTASTTGIFVNWATTSFNVLEDKDLLEVRLIVRKIKKVGTTTSTTTASSTYIVPAYEFSVNPKTQFATTTYVTFHPWPPAMPTYPGDIFPGPVTVVYKPWPGPVPPPIYATTTVTLPPLTPITATGTVYTGTVSTTQAIPAYTAITATGTAYVGTPSSTYPGDTFTKVTTVLQQPWPGTGLLSVSPGDVLQGTTTVYAAPWPGPVPPPIYSTTTMVFSSGTPITATGTVYLGTPPIYATTTKIYQPGQMVTATGTWFTGTPSIATTSTTTLYNVVPGDVFTATGTLTIFPWPGPVPPAVLATTTVTLPPGTPVSGTGTLSITLQHSSSTTITVAPSSKSTITYSYTFCGLDVVSGTTTCPGNVWGTTTPISLGVNEKAVYEITVEACDSAGNCGSDTVRVRLLRVCVDGPYLRCRYIPEGSGNFVTSMLPWVTDAWEYLATATGGGGNMLFKSTSSPTASSRVCTLEYQNSYYAYATQTPPSVTLYATAPPMYTHIFTTLNTYPIFNVALAESTFSSTTVPTTTPICTLNKYDEYFTYSTSACPYWSQLVGCNALPTPTVGPPNEWLYIFDGPVFAQGYFGTSAFYTWKPYLEGNRYGPDTSRYRFDFDDGNFPTTTLGINYGIAPRLYSSDFDKVLVYSISDEPGDMSQTPPCGTASVSVGTDVMNVVFHGGAGAGCVTKVGEYYWLNVQNNSPIANMPYTNLADPLTVWYNYSPI